MRISALVVAGLFVTTTTVVLVRLSERDDSRGAGSEHGDFSDGTEDPTLAPTHDRTPAPSPGDRLTISLSAEPAADYQGGGGDDGYREVAVTAADGRGIYDSALSRAAFELALQSSLHRTVATEDLTTFVLHSAGAPDTTAARFSLRTNDPGENVVERAIDEAISSPPGGVGDIYFGVGETATPSEPHSRHIIVLLVRRDFVLERTPRTAALGSTWEARGELPDGFAQPTAMALFPDGRLAPAELKIAGNRFSLRVDVGQSAGQLSVGIDGVGSSGPGKLLQVSVEIGRAPPNEMVVVVPEPPPHFGSNSEAEAYAARLLAVDRNAAQAPELIVDRELSDIARSHSKEMATTKYFAHQSPQTGLAGDRLKVGGYRASSFAENLAKNDNLAEAEASLLQSVGHRANMLSHDFSHVGIGIASAVERGQTQYYVTQLFATKTIDIDVDAIALSLYAEIDSTRKAAGRDPVTVSAALAQVARSGANQVAGGDIDDIAGRIGRRARDMSAQSVSVSVQVIYRTEQIKIPAESADGEATSVGIGVAQSTTDSAGRIGVVVITGR